MQLWCFPLQIEIFFFFKDILHVKRNTAGIFLSTLLINSVDFDNAFIFRYIDRLLAASDVGVLHLCVERMWFTAQGEGL